MRMRRLALLLVLSTVACGSPGPSVTGSGLRDAPAPDTSAVTDPSDPSGPHPDPQAEAQAVGLEQVSDEAGTTTSFPTNTMPLEVSVVPGCATRGTAMTAIIETRPHVILGMATEYSARFTPDMPGAPVESDSRGRFEWRWVLRPDTPLGPAKFKVAAGRSGVGQAAVETGFSVQEAC